MLARNATHNPSAGIGAGVFLEDAALRLRVPREDGEGPLVFGVDLGTATIVITAIDRRGRPIYWDSLPCEAGRDGVIVNFGDAGAAVKKLKATPPEALGGEL